jgi:phosphate uptake regulator
MKRNLIRLSPSTAVVSLPASWVKKNRLQKGDALEVQEVENAIMVGVESKRTARAITVDLREVDEKLAFAHADAAYVAGYDDITFLIKGKRQQEVMGFVATEVPGMIIVEQTQERVRFKDITGETREDVDALVARIFSMLVAMLDDALAAVKSRDWEVLVTMKRRDRVLNSYVSYCQRLMNKYGYVAFSKTGLLVAYLKLLEMLADHCCVLMRIVGRGRLDAQKELDRLLQAARLLHRLHTDYSEKRLAQFESLRSSLTTDRKIIIPAMATIADLLFDIVEVELQFQF